MRLGLTAQKFLRCTAILSLLATAGCKMSAVSASEAEAVQAEKAPRRVTAIQIQDDSPAASVREFYKNLKLKKFREAVYLTNLRPAIEGLTDNELKEFSVDLESIAAGVPDEVEINGEIISGDAATVTIKIPDDQGKAAIQQIRLRRSGGIWVILTVDEAAEALVRKEGKNYFRELRIQTHQDEARTMLERIAKAQIAYSVQNGGSFAEISELIAGGLLPEDIQTAESTGYRYAVELTADKTGYAATATPAVYGKSGKLSFRFDADGRSVPKIVSRDNGGRPLVK